MADVLTQTINWLDGHWGWLVAVFCVFFEVAPIKIHPITSLLNYIGNKLTAQVQADIQVLRRDTDENYNMLSKRLEETETNLDMQRAANIRALVLDFANACLNGRKHTKEEFDYILSENNVYEKLVEKYNLKNDIYTEDYNYVKMLYQECLRENKFLK